MARSVTKQQEICLLLGAGYSARALIPHLKARGLHVIATCRTHAAATKLRDMGVAPLIYKSGEAALLKTALREATHLISSIAPGKDGDPVMNDLGGDFSRYAPNLIWTAYLSATSVYGDRQGQWAFEDEYLRPVTARGRARIEAELRWLETDCAVHVFRLAGIYGKGRNAFNKIIKGTARAVIKPGHVVNRIHVQDICTALLASMDAPNAGQVYNIADGHPAPPQDVIAYAADLIGAPRPTKLDHNNAQISDMARSFYIETKAIDISRARKELSWEPQYTTYKEGLKATLKAEGISPIGVSLTGHIDIPAADQKAVLAALPEHIRLTQDEEGCAAFQITQDQSQPLRYHVYERFISAQAFDAHQTRSGKSAWGKAAKNAARSYDVFGL